MGWCLINDLLIRLCIYEQMCVWLCLSACALIYFPRCVLMTRGRWRPGSLVITPDILGSHLGKVGREDFLAAVEAAGCHLVTRRANQSAAQSRRSALTARMSPVSPPPPTQDLPPGQELLPAGLRGRRRDGGRGEAAPPHAGCDLFLFLSFHFSSLWP